MTPNQNVVKNDPAYLKNLPHLSEEFCSTFESVYIQTESLRLHAVIGGTGPALLLLGGWPQTWYTWRFIMPELAKDYTVIAADPPGVNLSEMAETGYYSATLAKDMINLMSELGYEKFAMTGFDIGMWTGYAMAADFPGKLERLAVIEAIIPGISPSVPLFSNDWLNGFLWHFAFNRAGDVNEKMVQGREEIYFGHQFTSKAASPDAVPTYAVDYYVGVLKKSAAALKASFDYYRSIDTIIKQNEIRKKTKLALPILAIGGEKGCSTGVEQEMRLVGDDVSGTIIPGGHFAPEEAPLELTAALKGFFNPYLLANR